MFWILGVKCLLFWCYRFCYVDLEDSSDLEKALALSGQKLKGQEVKIEQAKQKGETKAEKKTPQKDDAPKKRAGETWGLLFCACHLMEKIKFSLVSFMDTFTGLWVRSSSVKCM